MKRGKTNGKKIKIKLVCAHQHLRSLLAFHREPARKKNGECTTIEIARFQINYLEKIFLALKCWSFFSPFPTKITIFNANFMRYSQFFLFYFVFFSLFGCCYFYGSWLKYSIFSRTKHNISDYFSFFSFFSLSFGFGFFG